MARVHPVELDVGIADADMELDREAAFACDVSAGPDQVPLDHRVGQAHRASLLDLGEPAPGRGLDLGGRRASVVDAERRAIGQDRLEADDVLIVDSVAHGCLEGLSVIRRRDAALRDALCDRLHTHDFPRRRTGDCADVGYAAKLLRPVAAIDDVGADPGSGEEAPVYLSRTERTATLGVLRRRAERGQV